MTTLMLPATYSTKAVVEATGLTYRQVDYLARTEVLRPSVLDAGGSGTRRLYDGDDLRILRVLALLCRLGAGHDVLRRVVLGLRRRIEAGAWGGVVSIDEVGRLHGRLLPAGWVVDLDCIEA